MKLKGYAVSNRQMNLGRLDLAPNFVFEYLDLARGRLRRSTCLRGRRTGAAISTSRTKGSCSYLKEKFHRLKARRGGLRAALANAHKILVSVYHMLAKNLPYRDLGEAFLDQIGHTRTVANLKRRLERFGYRVTLEPNAHAT